MQTTVCIDDLRVALRVQSTVATGAGPSQRPPCRPSARNSAATTPVTATLSRRPSSLVGRMYAASTRRFSSLARIVPPHPPPPSPDERLTRAPPPPVLLGVCPPDPAQNGIIDRILTRTSASPRRNPPAERSISLRSFQPIVGLVSVSARLLGLAPCLRPPASRLSHYHDLTDRLPTGEREC